MRLIEFTQTCSKCGKRKSWLNFHKRKDNLLGLMSICKVCRKIYTKIYYKINSEIINIKVKTYRESNLEKIKNYFKINSEKFKAKQKDYRKANAEKIKAYSKSNAKRINAYGKAYRESNPEKVRAQRKAYKEANVKKIKAYNEAYKIANPEKIKAKNKKNNDKRERKPNSKLNNSMRKGIYYSLKNGSGKKGRSWKNLVPYTLVELINHLKKTIPVGYKWNDYVNGKTDLSLDHIIPISAHNFSDPKHQDFQRCWALKNLQLLPLIKNITKNAKLEKPFQPSLPL